VTRRGAVRAKEALGVCHCVVITNIVFLFFSVFFCYFYEAI